MTRVVVGNITGGKGTIGQQGDRHGGDDGMNLRLWFLGFHERSPCPTTNIICCVMVNT